MTTYGLVLTRPGLPEETEQRESIAAALSSDVSWVARSVITAGDIEREISAVLTQAGSGDAVAVSSLAVLGLGERPMLSVLADMAERGIEVMAADEGFSSAAQMPTMAVLGQLEAGAEAVRRAQAAAVVARAASRGAVTPQKAEFIPAQYADLMHPKDLR